MDTGTTTTETIDIRPITENQEKQYNLFYTDSVIFFVLQGMIVALLIVNIFVKGFQSNDR